MSGAPVLASPVPLPEFPVFAAAALVDAATTVVEVVVDVVEVVELVEPPPAVVDVVVAWAAVAASLSSSVATFRSAAVMAGVGGAEPKVSSSDCATDDEPDVLG
jgi:hypothetical protein